MTPTLPTLIEWAHEAGQILRAGFGQRFDVQQKGTHDLVTDIDRRSEELILARIAAHFPGHAIITEESGSLNGQHESCWYIDPLDGTINYTHGLGFFSVSIAYAEHGRLKLGVVYDPFHDETFAAEAGQGATLNGAPIRVTEAEALADTLLVTGLPKHLNYVDGQQAFDLFEAFTLRCQGVRRLGSAALDLCYVACGRMDGYWELHVNHYDVAAGALVASEAGARTTRADGGPDLLTMPCSILAANPRLYPAIRQVIQAHGV